MDVNTIRRDAATRAAGAGGPPVPAPAGAPGILWGFVPPQLRGHRTDTIFFEIDLLAILAGATAAGAYQTPASFGILVYGGVVELTAADGITPAASFAAIAQLTDAAQNVLVGSTGSSTTIGGAPVQNLFGLSANQPAYWPVPKWVGPQQNLNLSVTSREAVTKNARFTFWGTAVYV